MSSGTANTRLLKANPSQTDTCQSITCQSALVKPAEFLWPQNPEQSHLNALAKDPEQVVLFRAGLEAFAIDGSGLNADGSHTVAPDGFMWLNNGVFAQPNDSEPEIVFDLGAVYAVDTMLVWNYNEAGNFTKRGVGSAQILTAGADGVFPVLIENQVFDEAPGAGGVDFRQTIDLAGVKAQFIKLDISANLGGDNDFVGLSEVQFEGTLSP